METPTNDKQPDNDTNSSLISKLAKPTKPPKPLNARMKLFILHVSKGVKIGKAVELSGYNMIGDVASKYGNMLMNKVEVKGELERLYKLHESSAIVDVIEPFRKEFQNSLDTLKDLRDNGNDYVRLSATKEYLDRVSPKVTRNESIKYTIPSKEKARLTKLLDITDISQVR